MGPGRAQGPARVQGPGGCSFTDLGNVHYGVGLDPFPPLSVMHIPITPIWLLPNKEGFTFKDAYYTRDAGPLPPGV